MPKPTYAEIARRAGLGTATVERVLNGRGGVRPETAEKVVLAARALDWPGRLPERHRGITRIEVILVRPETAFYRRLHRAFRRIGAALDRSVQLAVTFVDEADPAGLAARIVAPAARRSGLVISAPDHPALRAALATVEADGLPVVQVVSRIGAGGAFVGIDNLAAGRLAGMMAARLGARRGAVLALCHSPVYRGHRERIRGFSDYLEGAEHGLDFRHLAFGRDDDREARRCVAEALDRWPDIVALYNAGGANEGVLDALSRAPRKIFFVGHELTEATGRALEQGRADVILDQLPEAQARRAVDILLSRIGLIAEPVENPPIRFTTITAENL